MEEVAEHPRNYVLIPPVEWGVWQTLSSNIAKVISTNGLTLGA